jgi:ferrochelatase
MRYGSPSIPTTLKALLADSPDELILLPMYPQYSSAATGSALEKVFSLVGKSWNVPAVQVIGPFFNNPGFLEAIVATGKPLIKSLAPDHILFSYHGLPERQIQKSQNTEGHCLKPNDTCCAVLSDQNSFCYRAQCYETSRQLVKRLGLEPGSYTTCFQSRLGRTPWIKPYTDIQIQELGRQGKKRVLVFSPSFVADCLETLEEISIRGLAAFIEAGGEQLVLVPSLNNSDVWVKTAADMVQNSSRGRLARE